MRTLIIAIILAAACSSPPAIQHHALDSADMSVLPLGSPCSSADCGWFTPDGATCAPGTDSCNWACPLCGVGNTCAIADDGSTTCQGPVCGNGNVVCPVSQQCSMSGDCLDPCLVGGVPWNPPQANGQNCGQLGLMTGVDSDGGIVCITPCLYAICDLVGGSCGST